MSRSLSAFCCRFVVFLGISLLLAGGISPAAAETPTGGGLGYRPSRWQIKGTGIEVTGSGSAINRLLAKCPFELLTGSSREKVYADAANAAKVGGDPDGCPFAVDMNGVSNEKVYLSVCRNFYRNMNLALPVTQGQPRPMTYIGCELEPSLRAEATLAAADIYETIKIKKGNALEGAAVLSMETSMAARKAEEERRKKEEWEKKQCKRDAKKRINEFWAKKKEVQCYKAVRNMVQSAIKNKVWNLKANIEQQIASAGTETWVSGALTAVQSYPSPLGIAKVAKIVASTAIKIVAIAQELAEELDKLNEGCAGVITGLQALDELQNIIDGLSCKGLASFIERQMTQCVRVNFSADLRLPRFSLALQCPVNLNINMTYAAGRFNCAASGSVSTGVNANLGGQSLLSSSDGSLSKAFSSDCFSSSEEQKALNGGVAGAAGSDLGGLPSSSGGRVPGSDCGKLDEGNPAKNEPIKGLKYLAANFTSNGWAVGGSETLAGSGLTVTRCDFYDNGERVRTNYVFGSGTSCNAGADGFMDSGYESNTACYPGGGYTPASLPNVPESCLYPADCLDGSGAFSSSREGTGNCPKPANPAFDETRTYATVSGGGIGPQETKTLSCKDFSEQLQPEVQCCDPQLQDCTKRDVNVKLCNCDSGNALNKIKMIPDINDPTGTAMVQDPEGSCEQGGKVTCCSESLNGKDWCLANMGLGSICKDETSKEDMCRAIGAPAKLLLPDGTTKNLTALDVTQARPSPYTYLFIRPDVKMEDGKQCCMTEWCNICPQHYVNAFGLSMVASQIPSATSDKENDALIGKGWPFRALRDDIGGSQYQVGLNPFPVLLDYSVYGKEIPAWKLNQDVKDANGLTTSPASVESTFQTLVAKPSLKNSQFIIPVKVADGEVAKIYRNFMYPQLQMGPDMQNKPTDLAISKCNSLSPYKVVWADTGNFVNGDFGFLMHGVKEVNLDETTMKDQFEETGIDGQAQVPAMRETPLAYINRIRETMSTGDKTLPPIELCSDMIKLCVPDANSPLTKADPLTGGADTGTGNRANDPVTTPPVTQPVTAPGGGTGGEQRLEQLSSRPATAPSVMVVPSVNSTKTGATAVPSASNSGSSSSAVKGSLY